MKNEDLVLFLQQIIGKYNLPNCDLESDNPWIDAYLNQITSIPNDLDIPTLKQEFFISFRILTLIAKSSNNLVQDLVKFLKYRAVLIQDQPHDYFQFPHSPMNQLCIHLVETLAKEDQDLLSLLLGRSLVKDYPILGATVRELTEIVVEGKRKLNLEGYLLSANKKAIIPFSWFDAHPDKTSPNLNYFHLNDKDELIPLDKRDLNHLKDLFGEESKALFDQFNFYEALCEDDKTLYSLFMKFINQLKIAAVNNDRDPSVYTQANEYMAGDEAKTAIEQFFNIWKHCPQSLKNRILELREKKYNPDDQIDISELEFAQTYPSIREYFLVLRGQLEEDDPELENQAQIRQRVTLLYCANLISDGLRSIVTQHQTEFNTTLEGLEIQAEDYHECLSRLHKKIAQTPAHQINYPKSSPHSTKNSLSIYIEQLTPQEERNSEGYQFKSIDEIHYLFAVIGIEETMQALIRSKNWNMTRNPLLQDSLIRDGERMTSFLVSIGISINSYFTGHNVLTHIAVIRDWQFLIYHLTKHIDHPKYLLHKNSFDLIPLDYALSQGKINIVQLLLKHKPVEQLLTRSAGILIFHKLLTSGDLQLIRSVLTHPVWNNEDLSKVLDAPLEGDQNALEICIKSNEIALAKLLINHHDHSDFYQINEFLGTTPIHNAIQLKRLEILEELIEAQNMESDETGATVRDYNGNTPLHLAVLTQDSQIFNTVLNLGDEAIFVRNNERLTPVQLAIKNDHYNAISSIITHLIFCEYSKRSIQEILNQSYEQTTTLDYILNQNVPEMRDTLKKHGFITSSSDNQGELALGNSYNKRLKKM